MESGSARPRRCERCGGSQDLYLLTRKPDAGQAGNALLCCSACRGDELFDVAVPLPLLSPRLLLGLQRLRKLDGNLSRLLIDEDRES